MTTEKTLKSGAKVLVEVIGRTGYSSTDKVLWTVRSSAMLDDDEIIEIVDREYPLQGYGPSKYFQKRSSMFNWVTTVESSASCGG